MTTKAKPKSAILAAVHETAGDMHRLGFIDKRRMQKYDALCLAPVPEFTADTIKAVRSRYKISQGRAGIGVEHQRFDGAPMGDWRQTSERPVRQTARPARPQGIGSAYLSVCPVRGNAPGNG
jgi:hypothetical protein